jgi:predicted O-methyltransferase YrrM
MAGEKIVSREQLHKIFVNSQFKVGAEIGVAKGENAVNMFERIPGLFLYLVDPWSGKGKRPYNGLRRFRMVRRKVSQFKVEIIRKESRHAVDLIPDMSLDFVYIDADHSYDMVMLDIILWSPKVKPGGIVSGHDYEVRMPGVKSAVDDYVRYYKIDLKIADSTNWYFELKE